MKVFQSVIESRATVLTLEWATVFARGAAFAAEGFRAIHVDSPAKRESTAIDVAHRVIEDISW
jgi:hypothetical protein